MPILDGSAAKWNELLQNAGKVQQDKPQTILKVLKPMCVQDGDRWMQIEPADHFSVDIDIAYEHGDIGTQRFHWDEKTSSFSDVAHAKTFAFSKDIEQLHAAGLGHGGSLENTVIIDESGVRNPEAMHYPDNEFARHKVLDILGDSMLAGMPIQGKITGHAPGHNLSHRLIQDLLSKSHNYQISEAYRNMLSSEGQQNQCQRVRHQ